MKRSQTLVLFLCLQDIRFFAAAAAASIRWNGSCPVVVTQLTDAELTDNYLNVDIMIVSRHHGRNSSFLSDKDTFLPLCNRTYPDIFRSSPFSQCMQVFQLVLTSQSWT